MIKFFRHIRQSLINQNRTKKYLLYAIGEIILVVIGILIALQINNWNESRKEKNRIKSIYAIIKKDLETDVAEIQLFLSDYDSIRKPVFETLLREKITKEEYYKNSNLERGFGGYKDIQINTRGYELFKNQPNTAVLEQELASEISNFYNVHLYEIEIAQRELSQDFTDNNFHLKHSGFSKNYVLGLPDDAFAEYIISSDDAKNRLSTYYLFYSIYAGELHNFESKANILIKEIDKFIKNND